MFTRSPAAGAPVFHALPPPRDDEVAEVLDQVYRRVRRLLRQGGRWPAGIVLERSGPIRGVLNYESGDGGLVLNKPELAGCDVSLRHLGHQPHALLFERMRPRPGSQKGET